MSIFHGKVAEEKDGERESCERQKTQKTVCKHTPNRVGTQYH